MKNIFMMIISMLLLSTFGSAEDVSEADLDKLMEQLRTRTELKEETVVQTRERLRLQLSECRSDNEKELAVESLAYCLKKDLDPQTADALIAQVRFRYRHAVAEGAPKKDAKKAGVLACRMTGDEYLRQRAAGTLEKGKDGEWLKKNVKNNYMKAERKMAAEVAEEKEQTQKRSRYRRRTGTEENGRKRGGSGRTDKGK